MNLNIHTPSWFHNKHQIHPPKTTRQPRMQTDTHSESQEYIDVSNNSHVENGSFEIMSVETSPQEDYVPTVVNRRTIYEPSVEEISSEEPDNLSTISLSFIAMHPKDLPQEPIVRKLSENGTIFVGRSNSNHLTDNSILLSSKVISRSHAEIALIDGVWKVRDIGSSSGTFINNMRLSEPSVRSEYFDLKSGDTVKFGVDFRDHADSCFHAMSFVVEINGGRDINITRFAAERFEMFRKQFDESETCNICLENLEPLQCILMMPCGHAWHLGCMYTLIGKRHPFLECPLCRRSFNINP